jgi:hypothetical protein
MSEDNLKIIQKTFQNNLPNIINVEIPYLQNQIQKVLLCHVTTHPSKNICRYFHKILFNLINYYFILYKSERFLLNFAKMTWKNLFNICWILLTLIHAMKKGETKADFVQYLNWPTSWVDKGGRSLRKETVWY